jgi:hypothetical protein
MTPYNVSWLQRRNIFQNTIDSLLRKGQLSLAGEENVNGKPAFKIRASLEGFKGEMISNLFIDKASYLLFKISADVVTDAGIVMTTEDYPSDYIETNGVFLPMKTTSYFGGMEDEVITVTKVEVDIPMEDSVFKVK